MKSVAIFAVSSLLAPALVAAVPLELEKRGVKTVTEYTTVTITITYTLSPGEEFTGLPEGYIPDYVAADITGAVPEPTDVVEHDDGSDDIEPVAEPEPVEEPVEDPVDEPVEEPVQEPEPIPEPEPVPEPIQETEPQVNSGGNGETFEGDITFYVPGLGSCGFVSGPSDRIVAISKDLFDQYTPNGNPNNNPLCGKQITIDHLGQQTVCTIADRCEGCVSLNF